MLDDLEILKAACCVAGLDGDVCAAELPMLVRLAERAGVGSASLAAMMDRALTDASFYETQLDFLGADPDGAIKTLFRVAVADGVLGLEERVVIQHLAAKVGLSDERIAKLLSAAEKAADG